MGWTPELIISLVTAATGFVGAFAAAIAIWMTRQERVAAHRQLLYQKQFEAYSAILDSVNALYVACLYFIVERDPVPHCLDGEERLQLHRAVFDETMQLSAEFHKWMLFLPAIVQDKVTEFLSVFDAISASDDDASLYPSAIVYADDPHMKLYDAYRIAIAAARQALGVDPLSEDTMRLVGTFEAKKRNKPPKGAQLD